MLVLVQITSIVLLTFRHADAVKPPGYVKPVEIPEKISPKYEYGYNIDDTKGSHGKLETRDGIYALGRYYVQGADSTSNVQYYADDWGFHPFIEYGNVGPHSRSRTQLLLGVEAVKALASNKFTAHSVPPKEHVTNTINSKVNSQIVESPVLQQQPQAQALVAQQPLIVQQPLQVKTVVTPQPLVLQQQQPLVQTVITHQPQIIQQPQSAQVLVAQQPQQTIVQQEELLLRQRQEDAAATAQQQQAVDVAQQQQRQQQTLAIAQEQQRQHQAIITAQEQQIQQQQAESYAQEQQRQQEAIEIAQQQQREQEGAAIAQQQTAFAISQQQQRQQQEAQSLAQERQKQQESIELTQQQQRQQKVATIAQQQQRQQVAFVIAQQQQRQQDQIQALARQQHEEQQVLIQQRELAPVSQQQSQQILLGQQNGQINQQQNQQVVVIDHQPQINSGLESNLIQNNNQQLSDEALSLATLGEFGARISSRLRAQIQRPHATNRLIETTRNLVTGQDVLNINRAADSVIIESSTLRPSINENLIQSVTEASLFQQPIIVEDFGDKIVSTTARIIDLSPKDCDKVFSTTASTLKTVSTKSYDVTEPSSVLVTPRPISTNFLAPLTTNVELQNQKVQIDVQKSLPYYLGEFQFAQGATGQNSLSVQQKAVNNLELGQTLLNFPGPQQLIRQQQQSDSITVESADQSNQQQQIQQEQQIQQQQQTQQQLPGLEIKENFVDIDQQQQQAVTPVIFEKPVEITKIIKAPYAVQVTKYIDRPYPVQVPVAQPVPYPVDRIVEKIVKQPYPVPVRVPVEVKVPYPVERIVEKQVSVPQIIEKQVPVDRLVEKQVPHYIHVQVPTTYSVPYNYQLPSVQITQKLNPIKSIGNYRAQEQLTLATSQEQANNGYLPPRTSPCDQPGSHSNVNPYYTIKPDDYIGLQPPRQHNVVNSLPRKFRNARSNFNSNLRVEYGFMPPLIPSLEIDENGQPLDKTHK